MLGTALVAEYAFDTSPASTQRNGDLGSCVPPPYHEGLAVRVFIPSYLSFYYALI